MESGISGFDELGDEILCGAQVALYVPPQGTEKREQLIRQILLMGPHTHNI